MQLIIPILILGSMWSGFFIVANRKSIGKAELFTYTAALTIVILLSAYYYSEFTALWCALSAVTGALASLLSGPGKKTGST